MNALFIILRIVTALTSVSAFLLLSLIVWFGYYAMSIFWQNKAVP